jgi:flagellin
MTRSKIQAEMDQLAKEISRISNTTEFNTQNLLAGGLTNTYHIGANAARALTWLTMLWMPRPLA